LQGQVDATAATDTGLATGRHRGLDDLDVIEIGKYLNVSSDLFVVKEDVYRQRKDALRRFLLAYRDAAGWMSAQPAEAARLARTRAIDGTDPELALEVIRLRNAASTSELTRREGPGTMDVASLQKAADVYKQLGLIGRAIDMRQVIAGDMLSKKP
jgi:NitT/TauT family transport system substrate-binding protein